MIESQPGYAQRFDQPGYAGSVPVPYVRASLGTRFFAYLLDIVFIAIFATLLWMAIAIVGVVTFGVGWALFPLVAASGVIYSAVTVGGSRQSTLGMRILGLRVVAPESGAPIDMITAAVHALLFYVAFSTLLLWCIDMAFGILRPDRRLGHDLLLGLAVVRP